LQRCLAVVPTAVNISAFASIHDVAALNLLVASSVVVFSAVADVFLPLAIFLSD
jgi:hypothetical protein